VSEFQHLKAGAIVTVYSVDHARRIIRIKYTGDLADCVLRGMYDSLVADVAYQSGYGVLVDCTQVSDVTLTGASTSEIARRAARDSNRMAIVAADPVAFGMARMYQIVTDSRNERVEVFRDAASAEAWLLSEP
jgi:hypothetical protein